MEETVSVLIWEDAMDMTDWARLLLAGSLRQGVKEGDWSRVLKSTAPSLHSDHEEQ